MLCITDIMIVKSSIKLTQFEALRLLSFAL